MAEQTPFGYAPAQYRGITDLFPSLGAFIQRNREKVRAPQRAKSLARAEGLLGSEGTSFEEFGQGDTAEFGQVQEPTGLMADPESFYNQMKYSLGLMATPGYEGAGRQFASQAMQSQLGMQGRQQAQRNWAAEQARLQGKTRRDITREQQAQANVLRDDFETRIDPLRNSVRMFGNVQNMFREKGVNNMTVADDEVMIKTLAKMILPKEAVMSMDAVELSKNEGLPSAMRAALAKIGVRTELQAEERRTLYSTILQMGGQQAQEYQDVRGQYQQMAQRDQVNPFDVMGQQMAIDTGDWSYAGASSGARTPPPEVTQADGSITVDSGEPDNPWIIQPVRPTPGTRAEARGRNPRQ